jgi:GNAT superfamily N-acetyltransferase
MIRIRPAQTDDAPVLLAMLQEAAADQGFPDSVVVTEDDLREDGFGPRQRFRALVAEMDGAPAGLALYFITWSSWNSRLGVYLEDLYVRAEFRRKGVGRQLMATLARIAVEEGCGRFHWVVHKANHRAIGLYESIGATMLDDWGLMYLKGDEIAAAADRDG